MEAAARQSGAKPPGAFGGIRPLVSTATLPEAVTSTLSPGRRLIPVSVHGTLAGTRMEMAPRGTGATLDGIFGARPGEDAGRAEAAGSWDKRARASILPAAAAL